MEPERKASGNLEQEISIAATWQKQLETVLWNTFLLLALNEKAEGNWDLLEIHKEVLKMGYSYYISPLVESKWFLESKGDIGNFHVFSSNNNNNLKNINDVTKLLIYLLSVTWSCVCMCAFVVKMDFYFLANSAVKQH